MARLPSARRAHNKSKNGCQNCKKKRIKCDEQIPCTRCVRGKLACSLSPLQTSTPTPEPSESIAITRAGHFRASDFALFHHFLTSTSLCLRHEPGTSMPWKKDIPELAPRHPYLLHELLAVAALHLHHLHPDQSSYQRTAQQHHAEALGHFRATLTSQSAGNEVLALFACSALMSTYYFASFEDPASLLFSLDPPGIPEWILPTRGCATLVRQFNHQLRTVGMAGLLYDYNQAWSGAGFLLRTDEFETEIQTLRIKLVDMNASEYHKRYESALQLLQRCFSLSEYGKVDSPRALAAMTFPSIVSIDFLEAMSKHKTPQALAIMGFWCVLLSKVVPGFWLRGEDVPREILGVITRCLPPEYLELIEWPRGQLGVALNLNDHEKY